MDKIIGVFQKLMPLLGFYPKWVQVLFTCCLILILITGFALITVYPAAAKSKEGFVSDGGLPALTASGRTFTRDYVIEAATMIVQLDAPGSDRKQSVADVRIVYTIFAINPTTLFDEGYHSMQKNVVIDRIRGSAPETDFTEPAPTHKSWNVQLPMQPGERQTIVTGAHYRFDLPLPDKRNVHDFTDLTPLEDAWCYPNLEDVIGELTIVVQSYRPIKAPRDGDMLLVNHSDSKEDKKRLDRPVLYIPDKDSSSPFILVGKWKNVMPKWNAEIHLIHE